MLPAFLTSLYPNVVYVAGGITSTPQPRIADVLRPGRQDGGATRCRGVLKDLTTLGRVH
jgi:hypothetical protein